MKRRALSILLAICLFPIIAAAEDFGNHPFHKKVNFVLNQFGGYLLLDQESIPLAYPNQNYPNIINTEYTLEHGISGANPYTMISYNPVPGVYMKYYFEEIMGSNGEENEHEHELVLFMETEESNVLDYTVEYIQKPSEEAFGYGGYAKILMALYIYATLKEESEIYYDDDPILQMDQGTDIFTPIKLLQFLDDLDRYVQSEDGEPYASSTLKFSEYITVSEMVKVAPVPDYLSVTLPEGIHRCYIWE